MGLQMSHFFHISVTVPLLLFMHWRCYVFLSLSQHSQKYGQILVSKKILYNINLVHFLLFIREYDIFEKTLLGSTEDKEKHKNRLYDLVKLKLRCVTLTLWLKCFLNQFLIKHISSYYEFIYLFHVF